MMNEELKSAAIEHLRKKEKIVEFDQCERLIAMDAFFCGAEWQERQIIKEIVTTAKKDALQITVNHIDPVPAWFGLIPVSTHNQ